jgi:hypothetical protein
VIHVGSWTNNRNIIWDIIVIIIIIINVTCRPIARERLGKQARNKYSTNIRVDPFLDNEHNNRTGVARSVSYVGRI